MKAIEYLESKAGRALYYKGSPIVPLEDAKRAVEIAKLEGNLKAIEDYLSEYQSEESEKERVKIISEIDKRMKL
jgi:hypothetical protein